MVAFRPSSARRRPGCTAPHPYGRGRAGSGRASTLQLAHALGLVLAAEGAEDQATVDALTTLGCDLVQGYHLSRPLPPEQLWTWLEERTAAAVR